ncbi:hypothetical protein ERO13_D11G189950v2 [Gossypium hirsutum]|nr:hypothetical protein ERO13_D11G189950v2 [Gossypium hirsutum]
MEPFALKMVEDPHIHNQLICKIYGIFNWIGFSPINQNPAGLLHQILEDLLAMILIICGSFFLSFSPSMIHRLRPLFFPLSIIPIKIWTEFFLKCKLPLGI